MFNKCTIILFLLCICFTTVKAKPQTMVSTGEKKEKNTITINENDDQAYMKVKIKGLVEKVNVVAVGSVSSLNENDLILGSDSTTYVYNIHEDSAKLLYSSLLSGKILKISIGDVDNDGKNDLVIAVGSPRKVDNQNIKIYLIQLKNDKWLQKEIYIKSTTRSDVSFLKVIDKDADGKNEIIVSYFNSKYFTETIILSNTDSGWIQTVLSKERMATSMDIGSLPNYDDKQHIVGRPYGDKIGDIGGAYILSNEKRHLPVFRGVESLKIGDGDNDGENEIFIGDGWHSDYGKIARGRIAVVNLENNLFNYKLIEDVKGQYNIEQIEIADIIGDEKNEVITRGNVFFRVYKFINNKWKVFFDPDIPHTQFSIGDIDGDKHPEIIFAGNRKNKELKIYSFVNPKFSANLGKEVITEDINPEEIIGKQAPELKIQKWYNGDFNSIKNSKGKVIVLDFWATWCVPCKKMFPKLRLWQEKYGKDGLIVLGITRLDRSQSLAKIENFVGKEGFNYPIGVSEESFNNIFYGVGPIPHMVLIDKKGVIRYYDVGYNDGETFEQEIIKLLR